MAAGSALTKPLDATLGAAARRQERRFDCGAAAMGKTAASNAVAEPCRLCRSGQGRGRCPPAPLWSTAQVLALPALLLQLQVLQLLDSSCCSRLLSL